MVSEKQQWMAKRGWISVWSIARDTGKGSSGGVLIACRGDTGIRELDIQWIDKQPQAHRAIAVELAIPGLPPMVLCS
eukprot:2906155-Lingulodinium_polyedra.AAC.1